ncbi:set domain protein [Culex quinquefasciatus]|uniref:Set domain protein n=1 Tax=Culex quinquefasciatus TaxID=7176 RepID=B0XKJ4_CULQU|nr:set domain protein [Culex quinquefasciatus]|eukprot:XP_001870166.1 set domain protein [Culex quinquefasciatus]
MMVNDTDLLMPMPEESGKVPRQSVRLVRARRMQPAAPGRNATDRGQEQCRRDGGGRTFVLGRRRGIFREQSHGGGVLTLAISPLLSSNKRQKGLNVTNPVINAEYVNELEKIGHTEPVEFTSIKNGGYFYIHRSCASCLFGVGRGAATGTLSILEGVVAQALSKMCYFCSRKGASLMCKVDTQATSRSRVSKHLFFPRCPVQNCSTTRASPRPVAGDTTTERDVDSEVRLKVPVLSAGRRPTGRRLSAVDVTSIVEAPPHLLQKKLTQTPISTPKSTPKPEEKIIPFAQAITTWTEFALASTICQNQIAAGRVGKRGKLQLQPPPALVKDDAIESVVAGSNFDNSFDDAKLEPLVTNEQDVVELRKKRQRNLQKLGIEDSDLAGTTKSRNRLTTTKTFRCVTSELLGGGADNYCVALNS